MTSYAAESLALKRCIVRYRSAILLQIRERQKTGEHQLKIGERHNQGGGSTSLVDSGPKIEML